MLAHLLIVDDDEGIRTLLKKFLVDSGFVVSTAKDAQKAELLMAQYQFDIIIMDIMMPGESGLEFLERYGEKLNTPLILLSALGSVDDRVNGLKSGADDYLAKPFEPEELLLRIHSILRRTGLKTENTEHRFGDFVFDTSTGMLSRNDENVYLTNVESEMLKTLCENASQIVLRDDIIKSKGENISSRTIDTQVARLRAKIEDNPKQPVYLHTSRGKGYVLYTD